MNILGKGIDAIKVISLNHDIKKANVDLMKNISLNKIVIGKYQPRKKVVAGVSIITPAFKYCY